MNQRASHFTLGNTTQDPRSVYTQSYTPKKANVDSNFKVVDPFRGNTINPSDKNSFATTNNATYKNWDNCQKAGLDK